jgi:hypothetical protein
MIFAVASNVQTAMTHQPGNSLLVWLFNNNYKFDNKTSSFPINTFAASYLNTQG